MMRESEADAATIPPPQTHPRAPAAQIIQIMVAAGGTAKPDILYALDQNGGIWRLVVDAKVINRIWVPLWP